MFPIYRSVIHYYHKMKSYINNLLYITACKGLLLVVTLGNPHSLTAVSFSLHARLLYQKLRNNGEGAPTQKDPALLDVKIRERICEDITNSELIRWWRLVPLSKNEIYQNRNYPEYSDIFHLIYSSSTSSRDSYEYTNSYRTYEFLLMANVHYLQEYVFVCPLRSLMSKDIVPYYVSKEYNVSPLGTQYMPGRFVFGNFAPGPPNLHNYLILAEELARAHKEAGFNVELHYLRMRRYVEPVENNTVDPLCTLLLGEANQHHRLCVAISGLAHFVYKPCDKLEISFRTTDGIKQVAGKSYHERVTPCYPGSHKHKTYLYISRAYQSNQVFVYRQDPAVGRIYLDNLATNISIVDELNSFDFVEE